MPETGEHSGDSGSRLHRLDREAAMCQALQHGGTQAGLTSARSEPVVGHRDRDVISLSSDLDDDVRGPSVTVGIGQSLFQDLLEFG